MQAPDGDPTQHRPSYATLFRNARWKLNVYHGTDYGELYALENDLGVDEASRAGASRYHAVTKTFNRNRKEQQL